MKPRKKRKHVRIAFDRRSGNAVKVEVMKKSRGRRVVGPRIALFKNRTKAFTWKAKGTRTGYYQVRFTTRAPNGKKDVRHVGLRKSKGRFRNIGAFDRRASCELVKYFRLRSPVFGGQDKRPLPVTFRLSEQATVSVTISRKGKVVKRTKARSYGPSSKRTVVIRLGRKAKRGLYVVKLKAERPGAASELTLFSRYL